MYGRVDPWAAVRLPTTFEGGGPISTTAGRAPLRELDCSLESVERVCSWPGLSRLRIRSRTFDIRGAEALTKLRSLHLGAARVASIEPVGQLTDLEELVVNDPKQKDLRPLGPLTRLEKLDLSQTRASDLSPLAALNRLEELDLSGMPFADVGPLADLSALRLLVLRDTPNLSSLGPLHGLKCLRLLVVDERLPAREIATLRKRLPLCEVEQ